MSVLSNEEIEYWIGSNSTKKAVARAIEAAVLEKLKQQVPVAWHFCQQGYWHFTDEKRDWYDAVNVEEVIPLYAAPVVVLAKEHDQQDVRCECCGYMTHHREHLGCIRAGRSTPNVVPNGLDDVVDVRQKLAMFESAVEHVTEEGKTKRSFSVSEGWAMVHKERLIDLECAEEQLVASQAREIQSLEAQFTVYKPTAPHGAQFKGAILDGELPLVYDQSPSSGFVASMKVAPIASLSQDTTAIEAMITKAGEVMRESVIEQCIAMGAMSRDGAFVEEIRALPGVTLEDLK